MKPPNFTIQMHYCDAQEGWWVETEPGDNINTWTVVQWCHENGIKYLYTTRGDTLRDRDCLLYAVFFDETDAMLFYLRFRK